MAALTKLKQRNHNMHTPQLVPLPVKAATNVFTGSIVCTDANALAVPGADTAGLVAHGVAYKGYDNSAGANGVVEQSSNTFGSERYVQVDQVGEWEFTVSAGTPKPGGSAFIVDSDTVSANATAQSIKLGTFTRPGNEGGWFVNVERR